MAGSNEIKYRVDVDASRASRGLSQFGKAASRAGKDVADAMDDTASAGDKARAAIEQLAQAMDTELRDAAAAADALATAMGPALTDKMNVQEVVADLNRMGVSFDEIRADADKFADTLRKIDGVNVRQVNDGLDGTKRALDGVRSNADQSRSVLANLAGNAAQDFGELGGVVGSLGVGVGQLAEYAVDGNIAMRNLAAVAGPMAGLSAALLLVQHIMGGIAKAKAFEKEEAAAFEQAIEDIGVGAAAVLAHLEDIGGLKYAADSGLIGFGTTIKDVTGLLADYGITAGEVSRVIAGTEEEQTAWFHALEASNIPVNEQAKIMEALRQGIENYGAGLESATERAGVFTRTQDEITSGFLQNRQALAEQDYLWRRIADDLADNGELSELNVDSYTHLQEVLGLTNSEMDEMARQKVAEQLEAQHDAARNLVDAVDAATGAVDDYNNTVRSAEFGATTFEAAETAMGTFFDLVQSGAENVVNLEEAYDNLGTAAEESNGKINFDTPEGRATYQALQGLGQTLIPEITQAFRDSGGDIGRFTGSMNDLSGRVLRRLQNELGLSQEDAQAMIRELGLVPENVETMYKLIGDEEAKAKLALLQGSIDALPDNVQTQVTQQIILGDYQGALRTVQNYYNRVGATIPVDADISRALEALRRLQAIARFSQVVVSVGAQSTGSSSAPAATSRTGVAATATVAAPVNVNINTSVVGNHYDLERVVSGAVRQGVRLAGRRHLGGGP